MSKTLIISCFDKKMHDPHRRSLKWNNLNNIFKILQLKIQMYTLLNSVIVVLGTYMSDMFSVL